MYNMCRFVRGYTATVYKCIEKGTNTSWAVKKIKKNYDHQWVRRHSDADNEDLSTVKINMSSCVQDRINAVLTEEYQLLWLNLAEQYLVTGSLLSRTWNC